MDANVRQWINAQPCLSNEIYESMKNIAEFKADMHCIYIRACKDPTRAWTSLPFVASDDVVDAVVDTWPPKWRGPEVVEHNEAAIWKLKEEVKCAAQQKQNE